MIPSATATAGSGASWKIPTPTTGKHASLYLHIPFCTRKCPYCHFYVAPDRADLKQLLLQALFLEWEQIRARFSGKKIASIYFGGGTPALFGPENISALLQLLPPAEEITLEANPAETTLDLLEAFRKAGCNRISIGVQSLDDKTLKTLGRTHTAEQAKEAILLARRAGFANITIDLMYDIPGQSLQSWQKTLDQIAGLPLEHVSLYNLTIEPNTPFYRRKKALMPFLPSSEESLAMLDSAVECFEALGLKRYEISAFARPGFSSVHNTGYWTGRPFWGLGPSAFSYWEGKRFRNVLDIKAYAKALQEGRSPVDFEEKLSPLAALHELLAVRLRLLEGVDRREYPVDPALYRKLVDRGWLAQEDFQARLTPQGLLFYDLVAEEIIL